jgi:hypothetical protein
MAKLHKGTRVILATAGVVLGLVIGIIVIALATGSGSKEPRPYQPFFAGTADRVTKQIKEDGPVCYPDPHQGDKAFCLDLDGTTTPGGTPGPPRIIALHLVPPGGTPACLVQWDRTGKRYEVCHGAPVDRASLARFPVLTKEIGDKTSVFVDLRATT